MNYNIEVNNVSKHYNGTNVLNNVSFQIRPGEVFGLLGPSGAGKTTILKILTGQISFEGEAIVLDKSCSDYTNNEFQKIGVVLDNIGLYERLTCYENLKIFSLINQVSTAKIDDVLERVKLSDEKNKKVNQLSRGMKQRLSLARAIMHTPKVLFLDEPTSGLDPVTINYIHDIILELVKEKTSIILATHNMEEAYKVCTNLGLLSQGKIIEYGSPSMICQKYNEENGYHVILKNNELLRISISQENLDRLAEYIRRGDVQSIHSMETNLEEVFIKLTGERLL